MQKYSKLVKMANRQKLTPEEMALNRQELMKIFPEYCKGWGDGLSPSTLQKLDDILEKMEVEHFTADISRHLQAKEK